MVPSATQRPTYMPRRSQKTPMSRKELTSMRRRSVRNCEKTLTLLTMPWCCAPPRASMSRTLASICPCARAWGVVSSAPERGGGKRQVRQRGSGAHPLPGLERATQRLDALGGVRLVLSEAPQLIGCGLKLPVNGARRQKRLEAFEVRLRWRLVVKVLGLALKVLVHSKDEMVRKSPVWWAWRTRIRIELPRPANGRVASAWRRHADVMLACRDTRGCIAAAQYRE